MEKTQEIIKKINIFSRFPMDELYLTFTTVNACNDKRLCTGSSFWKNLQKRENNYVTEALVRIDKDHFYLGLFLHERIHEYINYENSFLIRRHNLPPVYIGDKTVRLAIDDYNSGNFEYTNMLVQINGRYGLVMQDGAHLGNWGVGSTPSSYHHIRNDFYIGKYVISVMEEIGYKFTNPIDAKFFEKQLNFHSNFSSEMKMHSCNIK
jgi:hypothetical protein